MLLNKTNCLIDPAYNNFSLTFSEAVVAGTGSIRLYRNVTQVASIPATDAVLEPTLYKTISFKFVNESMTTYSSWYSIVIDSNAFSDSAGQTIYGSKEKATYINIYIIYMHICI
jgi:hypothetical protein